MPEPRTPAAGEPTFEAGMTRLDAIVQELEHGTLGLQQSLVVFREGLLLVARLGEELDTASALVEELVEAADGALRTRPFSGDGGHGATARGGRVEDVDEAGDDE